MTRLARLSGDSDGGCGQCRQEARVHHHPELDQTDGGADERGYLSADEQIQVPGITLPHATPEHCYLLSDNSANWVCPKKADVNNGMIALNMTVTSNDPCLQIQPAHNKKLTDDTDAEDDDFSSTRTSQSDTLVTWRTVFTLTVLLFANLLNYMDRFTIGGVLTDIKHFYDISNSEAGLLQTSFICSYMIFSPIFGFLGDRYNRKIIMAVGIAFWSGITLASSFIPSDKYIVFLLMRGLVGIGEASYSTIAPTIIADLFVGTKRTKALSVFYFAIPVGSGMGYIVGTEVAKAAGSWQWALRVTPMLGAVCVVLVLLLVQEPPRGASEGGNSLEHTSYLSDLSYLVHNRSFVFSTLGFTCVAFVTGALALWTPFFMQYAIDVMNGKTFDDLNSNDMVSIGLIFGVITCAAGFIGVGLGTFVASKLRNITKAADPLVCAFGLLASAPFLYGAVVLSRYKEVVVWVMVFFSEVFVCLNWALVTDITLYTVIPTRRSTAEAMQILISHAFGDAGSPYLIGLMSDYFRTSESPFGQYISLYYSLYITCFVAVIGGGFFLTTALFVDEDRRKADILSKTGLNAVIVGESPVASLSSGLSNESNTRTQTTVVLPPSQNNHAVEAFA